METLLWILCGWAGLAGLVWLLRNAALTVAPRWVPEVVPADAERVPSPAPRVSIVVAAKDEEAGIADCVSSLLAQQYPELEVLIVDDRSSDRTAEIVEGLAARDARLRLLRVRELPAGWFGKAHAVHVGIAAATGEWFCLTDADCRFHHPQFVAATVGHAEAAGVDLLSLLPMVDMPYWWQQLTEPLNCGLVLLAFHPLRLNDPQAREHGAAFAAYMLIRRSAHVAFGGHSAVAATLGEDIELGRRAKQAGTRVLICRHDRLTTTAAYPTVGSSFRGWSRVLYAALRGPTRLLVQLALVLSFGLGPQLLFLGSLLAAAAGVLDPATTLGGWLLGLSATAWALQVSATARFYRWCGSPAGYALLYLPAAAWQFAILLHALWRCRPGADLSWRGTTYVPAAVTAPGEPTVHEAAAPPPSERPS